MLTYLRYALAAVCFACCASCVALWWRSQTDRDMLQGPIYVVPGRVMSLYSCAGVGAIQLLAQNSFASGESEWVHANSQPSRWGHDGIAQYVKANGQFETLANGLIDFGVRFPLWYPALVFALAGVGVLRFRRQFSIRSALVCLTVVAALLGMVVVL